jgi:general secretion pathway protein D
MRNNRSGRPAAGYGVALALATSVVLAGCAELNQLLDIEGAGAIAPVGVARPGEDAARTAAESAVAEAALAEVAPAPARPETERVEGSGDFVAAPAQVLGAGPGGRVGDITLNFVNADVREVVRSVLGDTLGENYVLDPRVQGTITVQTSRPLPRGALLPMLEEILGLNGFALVRKPDNYVVLPVQEAINTAGVSGPFLPGGGVTRGFAIRILPLEHVGAREMARILEPMTPAGGVLRVDAARNLLVIAGTQHELQALQELVAIFDVDWMSGTSFALVPLDYADAETVIGELESVFGGAEDGPLAGLLRFIAVERVNAVLVIAGRPDHLKQAESWIARLDKGEGEGETRRLFVYYVKNARAEDLAAVLSEAFAPARGEEVPRARLAPGAERVEVGGVRATAATTAAAVEQLRAQRRERVAEGEAPPAAEVEPVGAIARGAEGVGPGISLVTEGDIRIIADEANNALVILATAREYRMIEAALKKLDIVPLQVLIEATIAEVTLTDDLRYGVQWFLQEGNSAFTLSEFATGAATQVFPGFSYLLTGGLDFRLVLNALESITDVNVISSPQLMVLDNQTAELQVGSDVPVATQQALAVTGDAPLVNTIQFRETGIILRVTPRVNPGGLVIMEIEQEVSTVVPGADPLTPTIQQRRILSTIAVQSGETVVLGGLIQDNRTRAKSGVPFLQDIPLLGELFSTTSDVDIRTELLVVITPRVVGSPEEARAVTEELRRKMPAVVPLGARVEERTMDLDVEGNE